MTTCGSYIDKFYLCFYTNYNELVSCGEHNDDPLSLLWDVFNIDAKSAFMNYIKSKEENFLKIQDYINCISHKGLITVVTNEHNILKKSVNCGAKSPDKE